MKGFIDMELISDGALANIDTEHAVVTGLHDLLRGSYLRENGLSVCFPFADRAASARLLTEQATARILVQREDALHLAFSSNAETKTVFASSFQLMMIFCVEGARLKVDCTLNNIGMEEALPFYLGMDVRPRCPLFDWEEIADYGVQTIQNGLPAQSAQFVNRKTGRGLEFGWKGISLQSENTVPSGEMCLTFDASHAEQNSLPPMQSWHASLYMDLL